MTMKTLIFSVLMFFGLQSGAQITRVSLQASGLTCSMCSKAVLIALQKVDFVEKVQVNIKNQEYNLTFKPAAKVDFDALHKAVDDAGFGVAKFVITAQVDHERKIEKDEHLLIGDKYFHFLNGIDKQIGGETIITLVDKNFTSAKDFKKYSSMSKMKCVQTGRMAQCCSKEAVKENSRVYHVII